AMSAVINVLIFHILSTATTGGGEEDEVILPVLENFDSYFLNIIKDIDYGGDVDDCMVYVHSVLQINWRI
ncbi:hypothetical protein HUN34_21910, partial [Acinetobacter bereziniae]